MRGMINFGEADFNRVIATTLHSTRTGGEDSVNTQSPVTDKCGNTGGLLSGRAFENRRFIS